MNEHRLADQLLYDKCALWDMNASLYEGTHFENKGWCAETLLLAKFSSNFVAMCSFPRIFEYLGLGFFLFFPLSLLLSSEHALLPSQPSRPRSIILGSEHGATALGCVGSASQDPANTRLTTNTSVRGSWQPQISYLPSAVRDEC